MPQVKEHKVRAENLHSWNADHAFTRKYLNLPIICYSFIDEDLQKFEYLSNIPESQKMRVYKIGTIAHEIGHCIYYYLMNSDMCKEWAELIGKIGKNITEYSAKYAIGIHGNQIDLGEEFAEAIRLKTTVPRYLKEEFLEVDQFLNLKFDQNFKIRNQLTM